MGLRVLMKIGSLRSSRQQKKKRVRGNKRGKRVLTTFLWTTLLFPTVAIIKENYQRKWISSRSTSPAPLTSRTPGNVPLVVDYAVNGFVIHGKTFGRPLLQSV